MNPYNSWLTNLFLCLQEKEEGIVTTKNRRIISSSKNKNSSNPHGFSICLIMQFLNLNVMDAMLKL